MTKALALTLCLGLSPAFAGVFDGFPEPIIKVIQPPKPPPAPPPPQRIVNLRSPYEQTQVDLLYDSECRVKDGTAHSSIAAAQGRIDWAWKCFPDQMEVNGLSPIAGKVAPGFAFLVPFVRAKQILVVVPVFGLRSGYYVDAPIRGDLPCDILDRTYNRQVNMVGLCFNELKTE